MSASSITLGIDLAAQAKVTAACAVVWLEGRATIERLECPLDDDLIVQKIVAYTPTKVAIDAPFGWPDTLVAALTAWHEGQPWPGTGTPELRLRLTDHIVIREAQQQPLSVSSDRIAVTAWRCARLLTTLRSSGMDVRRDGSGLAVEVYPAAACAKPGRGVGSLTLKPQI